MLGTEVLALDGDGVHVPLRTLLRALGERGINTLVVEGGARTLASFFESALVRRVRAYVASKLVGGRTAPGPLGGRGVSHIDTAWVLRDVRIERLGDDVVVDGCVAEGREEDSNVQRYR
ncbi:MAG: dihydrofolate reductase family protein [Chloroflexia bacterium]